MSFVLINNCNNCKFNESKHHNNLEGDRTHSAHPFYLLINITIMGSLQYPVQEMYFFIVHLLTYRTFN